MTRKSKMQLCDLPEEIMLQILKETPVKTLFDSVRLVSRAYNVRVHNLFTSPMYINYVLDQFDPCFKLQLSYPDGPSRPDLFMNATLLLPWHTPRDLSRVRMKLEGVFGGVQDRVMVWIDGNYKPITSLAVRWVDAVPASTAIPTLSTTESNFNGQQEVDSSGESATVPNVSPYVSGESAIEQRQTSKVQAVASRAGWYEGVVDWWSIFQNMARVTARPPGDYGMSVPSRSFLAFTRLSGFDCYSKYPLQMLTRQELDRAFQSGRATLP